MKETITKNEKSLKVLNELVSREFYKGKIESEKFELKRSIFPNNYIVIGELNDENKFVLKSGFGSTIKILSLITNTFFLILFIFFLFQFNWIMLIVFILLCGISYLIHHIKTKKELKIFSKKYFELYKLIHNEA
ncbi:hypothetical protein N1F78_05535 [Seonamhaeicola sp. MEBiC1930]|uniref:hypothetical protein n=1 Tax=Seonamhaeicola sp. MEBiC01930 TaxID=2976768 RepID=UPI0032505D61